MKTINEINLIAGEYAPGDVVTYTAKPGNGKTSFMVFEAVSAAINGNKVMLCSLEVSTKRLEGLANTSAASRTKNRKLDIVTTSFNVGEPAILERIKRFVKNRKSRGKDINIVFIDSFGLCKIDQSKSMCKHFEDSLKELKEMARELQVAFVVNYPMNNSGDAEYTNALEGYADFAFVLERESAQFKIRLIYKRGKWVNYIISGIFDFQKVSLLLLDFSFDGKIIPLINLFEGLVCIVSSSQEIGKKFMIISSEILSKLGKRVFWLGDISKEDETIIAQRTKNNSGNVFFGEPIADVGEFFSKIEYIIDFYDIDTLVVDDVDLYCGKTIEKIVDFSEKLREMAIKKKCTIVFGTGTRKQNEYKDIDFADVSRSHVKVAVSDAVISIRNYKPSFWKRLLFWRPKKNTKIAVLKNRRGSDNHSYLSYIDYDENKIKIL